MIELYSGQKEGGVEHVATLSNLNPSFLELLWVELGLGFDNDKVSFIAIQESTLL